jgi:hypothetical protein
MLDSSDIDDGKGRQSKPDIRVVLALFWGQSFFFNGAQEMNTLLDQRLSQMKMMHMNADTNSKALLPNAISE